MDIKKIFNKKKVKTKQGGHTEGGGNSEATSVNSVTSTASSSSNSSAKIPTNPAPSHNADVFTSSKSFQYSYNSNTNSLFSSKRTLSTGVSTQPSSNVSYNKNNEQAKITSIGRPLRVLHEDEQEVEYARSGSVYNIEGKSTAADDDSTASGLDANSNRAASIHRNSTSRRRSNLSDDVSLCPTEKSNISTQGTFANIDNGSNTNLNRSQSSSISESELRVQLVEFIKSQLRNLANSVSNIIIQVSQSVLNLTKASITINESIILTHKMIKSNKYISLLASNQFDTINSVGLRRLIKNILHLLDNLLIGDVYNKSKSSVIKRLHDLFLLIKIIPTKAPELTNFISYMAPTMFPIDSNVLNFPNVEKVDQIMSSLLSKGKENLFSDQDGSFIAPVLRGFFLPSLTIITFIFGFPEISKEHHDIIKFFSTQSSDIHFQLQKNRITYASSKSMKLKSPFRTVDEGQVYVPISMSLSTDSSTISSGTLGGYLYPKVPENCSNPKLLKYRGQIFGLTCAHVVLGSESESEELHPNVSTPSPVLINLYKNALLNEMMNHSTNSPEYRAYSEAVKMIDAEYPLRKVSLNGKKVNRNLPTEDLGCIIWGERLINDNKLSDMAIIKINDRLKKKFVNYLGEDLQLSQYDPSLILSNLNVKKTISFQPRKNGILNTANLSVFKVGSTTGYTNGNLNGMKMIYWSDGSLRSSEFIVAGGDGKMKGFANGGDSGAWVLSKLSDVNHIKSYSSDSEDEPLIEEDENKSSLSAFIESFIPAVSSGRRQDRASGSRRRSTPTASAAATTADAGLGPFNGPKEKNEESGLGVLGMLHSYDGEYRQFGLFTPIDDIMERLEAVTGVEWGVVGCSEEGDLHEGSSSIGSTSDGSDKEESEDE
ncbi:hypothetical protein PICMEDRAFT_70048 [Pichia membranifaciens NRRL Y-2026]|uniref:Uncharacterized protein n=1 Tax=Pichia membranifaciens NRRL Y-2026 TaxID=763406 RepID=A0A1E3NQN9_9ASCO|nr:hypothetical protein PICMEDRAFT_70048 [Pichia membranifaciens NRRL Y-2026]ODQ48411.1 hypothetical protein PICMEDRAFT_70048 [Pichia membranifaciens NRRL Y-2026]